MLKTGNQGYNYNTKLVSNHVTAYHQYISISVSVVRQSTTKGWEPVTITGLTAPLKYHPTDLMMHYCPLLLFYPSISPSFFSNHGICKPLPFSRTLRTVAFEWGRHFFSFCACGRAWNAGSRALKGRNGTRCLLLSCPPPSVPASLSLLIQPVRHSTRAIPLDVEASLPAALARLFFPSLSSFWLPLFSCALPCFNPGIQISLNSWGESAGALVTAVDLIKTPRNRSGNIKVRKYNKSPRVNWTGGHLILFMNRIHASQICGAQSLNPQVMM